MKNLLLLIFAISIFSCGSEATTETAEANKTATKTANKENVPLGGKKANATAQKPNITTKTQQQPEAVAVSDYKAKNEGWLVNLEEARALSAKTGKPIMANFTGSDWCGWCKRLDQSVFHQPGFDKWAEENVILLELDFPRRFRVPNEVAQQNNGLKQALGVRGFPTIWVFDVDDKDGKMNINPYGKTGYTKTLAEFQKTIEEFLKKKNG